MTLLMNNTALRNGFRSGDRSVLEQVYREYSRSLFSMLLHGFPVESQHKRFTFRGYKDPWQLENAVQEIFARAFAESARRAYDGIRPYKNYLMTIARNYVVDSFRRRQKESVFFDDLPTYRFSELPFPDDGTPKNPESQAVNRQLKEETAKFVGALDPDTKKLFDARFVRGLSVEASASELQISEYRVKREERRIRKNFFSYMRTRGFFEGFEYVSPATALVFALSSLLAAGERFY
jgi:RNA polymerase sigma-70 factor (ECF subfamily)